MPIRWLAFLTVVMAAGLSLGGPARAAGPLTLRYFQELRARRLYGVAEQECLHQLARKKLSPADRADLTVELSTTLVEHASYVGDREQQEMWLRAREALKDLLTREPTNPRTILLEAQLALIPAAEANWCRWQAELLPYDDGWSEQARKAVDEALPLLLEVEKRLAGILRAGRKDLPAEFPKPFELRALLANVNFRRAQAQLDAALIPGTPAPDRSAALIQAERLLKPMTESNEGDQIAWSSRALYVECLRQMGEGPRALRTLAGYESQTVPPEQADTIAAERVRLLRVDQPAQATRQLDAALNAHETLSSELAFLKTQQLADAVRDAIRLKSPDVTQRHVELQDFVERIQNEVGGFWSYRSAVVQQQVEDELRYGIDIAPLVRKAESDFRRGRTDAALDGYALAITKSEESGRTKQAFDLGYIRASVSVNAKRWADAVGELHRMLEQQPTHPQAPDIHLLRAYALGRLYEEKPTQARRQDYTTALETLRELFPKHAAFGEATWMLADLEDRRNQVTVALQLFGEIPPTHPRAAAARLRQAQCYPKVLDRLRELKRPTEAWETEAVEKLTAMLPIDATSPLDETQIETALLLARVQMERAVPDSKSAEAWLARVFASLSKLPAAEDATKGDARKSLQSRSKRLRVVSLAAQGQPQSALELLKQVSTSEPAELLWILETLVPLTGQVGEGARDDLVKLQLQAAQSLTPRRAALTAAQQRRFDECLARIYLAAGQPQRALAVYPDLTKSSPDDRATLQTFGELLQKEGTNDRLSLALVIWQKLESLESAGSIPWLQARLQVCRSLAALGKNAECRKLIAETRTVAPKLGTPELTKRFADVESRVK